MTEAISSGGAARIDRQWLTMGAAGVVLASLVSILYNVRVKPGENGGLKDYLVTVAGLVVLGAFLYLLVFPRIANPATGALVAGILAVLLIIAFWSAVQLLFLPAAYAFWRQASTSNLARVGFGIAALAAALDVVAAISNAF